MSMILIGNAKAGSNGDAPQEGQDWIINQDTHVWDEEISVKNIIVNIGSGLKLENVTLNSFGSIKIYSDSEWINSTVYHDKENLDENISLYKQLSLVNTELVMNATGEAGQGDANVFYVDKNALLIIRDFDGDKETTFDQSIVRGDNSHVTNKSLQNSYSISIGSCVSSSCSNDVGNIDYSNILIENSFFENIYALRIYGNDTYIKNSTFNNSGHIVSTGHNTIFTNNTLMNSWTFWDLVILDGDNAIIVDNQMLNGYAGFGIINSHNSIIKNNSCESYFGYCLRLDRSNNSIVSNNYFANKTSYASIIIDEGDNNTLIHNIFYNTSANDDTIRINGNYNTLSFNYFENCSYSGNWYSVCIEICPYCFGSTELNIMNNITSNIFVNSTAAALLLSNVEHSLIKNNHVVGPKEARPHLAGFVPMRYPQSYDGNYTKAPSNNTFENNLIENVSVGISFDYFGAPFGPAGFGNIVRNNVINNVDIGIQVWAMYENMTIQNNTINAIDFGSYFFDTSGRSGIYLKASSSTPNLVNFTLSDNVIYSEIGVGLITDYTDGLQVFNNDITTVSGSDGFGNGIMCRNSISTIFNNNTVNVNLSKDSAAAGMYVYSGLDIIITNNSIKAPIGIEITAYGAPNEFIEITSNHLETINYGIISNRSFTSLTENIIQGTCAHSSCSVVNFNEVSKYGVFSQESTLKIQDNEMSNFYEFFASYLSDFNLTNNKFNFGHVSIKANNSAGSIYLNNFTNSSTMFLLFKSELDIVDNSLTFFETGIHSFNSSVDIGGNVFANGDLCAEFIDSDFSEFDNLFECRNNNIRVSYTISVRIANEKDEGSYNHPFKIYNSQGNLVVDDNTQLSGDAGYYVLEVYRLTSEDVEIGNNPFSLHYTNNEVSVVYHRNINYNQTILGVIDTTPPTSSVTGEGPIVNKKAIVLNVIIDDNDDFKEYFLDYLVNDKFSEWEVYGTFTDTNITFIADEGKEYRFRTRAIDIFGNSEQKEDYEHQVEVDTTALKTNILEFEDDYYFVGNPNVVISWGTDAEDVSYTKLDIYYTNFTTPYLNPNSVTWTLIDSFMLYDLEEFSYNLSNKGHYAILIQSTDFAGNYESKEDFDLIFNYNSKADTISFEEVPERWGYDYLSIGYETNNLNMDYEIYLAIENIYLENPNFVWYLYPYDENVMSLDMQGLQDSTRYYLYAKSRDLAGNVENPLETTEYFSSNGQYDQTFELKYLPIISSNYNFIITIDNDLDGIYEKELKRGSSSGKLLVDEYYLDIRNKTIVFGGTSNGGFVPTEDINNIQNIKVEYSGVHLIFEIYTEDPAKANSLTITHNNATELILTYNIPIDADTCKVQMTTDVTNWYNQEIISPCKSGFYQYYHRNPDVEKQYFYRIQIEDEFGHESYSDNRTVNMDDVIKLYSSSGTNSNNQFGMREILPAAIGISLVFLLFGGVLLYRSKNEELDENVSVIESKPVAKYKVEELYLIYKDGRLLKNVSAVEVKTDTDIMSGMLTAINDFVQDSFNTEGDLGSIDYGNNKIILQRGNYSYLAAVIYGEIDNKFKGKLINAVRTIETINSSLSNWDGDSESVKQAELYLNPIIEETISATREMVDNYFTEKEIIVTSSYEKIGNIAEISVNISNYSSSPIQACKIVPEFNSNILSLIGINPDISYSFAENSFAVGEISSYNEIQFKLKMQIKVASQTIVEMKMNYEQKGRKGSTVSKLELL